MTEAFKDLDDERFARWIERLRLTIPVEEDKALNHDLSTTAAESTSADDKSIIQLIKSSVESEASSLPKWLLKIKNRADIMKVLSSTSDLRYLLRHFVTPHAYHAFMTFTSNQHEVKPGDEPAATSSSSLSSLWFGSYSQDTINQFFHRLSFNERDEIIGLCRLADIHHRIHRANRNDERTLQQIIKIENRHQSKLDKQRNMRGNIINDLSEDNKESLYSTCSSSLQTMLHSNRVALRTAEAEEVKARLAYEAAIEKKRVAQSKVIEIESISSSMTEQRNVLMKVNTSRLEVDEYNHTNSINRVKLFSTLQHHLTTIRQQIIHDKVSSEIIKLFDNLTSIVLSFASLDTMTSSHMSSSDRDSYDDRLYYTLRIGLETIRLWKKLSYGMSDDQALSSAIFNLEKLISSSMASVPPPSRTIDGPMFHGDNATVVLYFDHLLHNTPPDHVESEARVQTSLRLIAAQADQFNSSSDVSSVRKLSMLKCNEIISAPFWCLPLVHSPDYLSHLWSLSKEAREFDLLVPLEFDTEWESLDDSDDDHDDDHDDDEQHMKIARKKSSYHKNSLLKPTIQLPEDVRSNMDATVANKLSELLQPHHQDDEFVNILYADSIKVKASMDDMPMTSSRDNDARKRKRNKSLSRGNTAGVDDVIGDRRFLKNRGLSHQPSNQIESDDIAVLTPYGKGVVVRSQYMQHNRAETIIPVKFEWGAIGYMNASVVQIVKPQKYGGVNREVIVNILLDDYSSVKPIPITQDRRYQHIDAVLHRIFARLVDAAGVQKTLTDAMGIDRAKSSLWVHGRTSMGLSSELETSMKLWLYKIAREEVDKRYAMGDRSYVIKMLGRMRDQLGHAASNISNDGNTVNILSSGVLKPLKSSSTKRSEPKPMDSDDDDDEDNDDNNFDDDSDDMNDDESYRKRRRPNTQSRPKKQSQSTSRDDDEYENNTTRRRSGPVPIIAPPGTMPEEKALRNILKKLMDERKISQGGVAAAYMNKYGCPSADQHKVSSWFRYKLNVTLVSSFNDYAAFWLRDNSKYLDVEAKDVVTMYIQWKAKRRNQSAIPADYERLLAAIKLYHGDDVDVTSSDSDEFNQSLMVLLQPLQQPQQHVYVGSILAKNDDDANSMDVVPSEGENITYDHPTSSTTCVPVMDDELMKFLGVNHIITLFDLHKFIFRELRRRRLSVAMVYSLTQLHTSSIEEPLLASFLANRKALDTNYGSLIVYHLIRWLMESTKIAEQVKPSSSSSQAVSKPQVPMPPVIDGKCPYCNARITEFNTSAGFSMHLTWCHRRHLAQSSAIFNPPSSTSTTQVIKQEDDDVNIEFPTPMEVDDSSSSMITTTNDNGSTTSSHMPQHRLLEISQDNLPDVGMITTPTDENPTDSMIGSSLTSAVIIINNIDDKESSSQLGDINLSSSSSGPSRYDAINTSIGRYSEPLFHESSIVAADKFPAGSHYYACEICKRPEAPLLCVSCPCSFHPKCVLSAYKVMPPSSDNYLCGKCEENKVNDTRILEEGEKNDALVGNWVMVYSAFLHRWRQAYVIKCGPRANIFLLKFWRSDNKGGKSYWMDISNTRILSMNSIPFTTTSSSSMQVSTQGRSNQQGSSSSSRGLSTDKTSLRNNNGDMPRNAATGMDTSDREEDIDGDQPPAMGMTDTYVSCQSVHAALCATGIACRAVDIVMTNSNTNVFACIRPPGHHAGRFGCTKKCVSTGFCLLNNAVMALVYSRVRWGLERVAVVDIDVHFGNGTAELLRYDPSAFFASVHMLYHDAGVNDKSSSIDKDKRFYPEPLGITEYTDNYVSIGVSPAHDEQSNDMTMQNDDSESSLSGPQGYRVAIQRIIDRLIKFQPQLLIISAGFDGYRSDPIGGELKLELDDYHWSTKQLMNAMDVIHGAGKGRVISLLEGGYDTESDTMGLAKCVNAHVKALRDQV